jgi:hypothetical protein
MAGQDLPLVAAPLEGAHLQQCRAATAGVSGSQTGATETRGVKVQNGSQVLHILKGKYCKVLCVTYL